MAIDRTPEWGKKLAKLVGQEVESSPPAHNAVLARLTDIDGDGVAALVSKLKRKKKSPSTEEEYRGFALVFQHEENYKEFEWLQFITRQLVVDNAAIEGNLVVKTYTTSYELVDSAAEIEDYTFTAGSEPANWKTCWNIDSSIRPMPKPFFRQTYDYAISA